jgi:Flp pilus assembly protein TadD
LPPDEPAAASADAPIESGNAREELADEDDIEIEIDDAAFEDSEEAVDAAPETQAEDATDEPVDEDATDVGLDDELELSEELVADEEPGEATAAAASVLGFTASRAIWNGDYAQALELWRRAAAQDPLSPTVRANLGYMLMLNDRLDEALAECRRALELNPTAGSMLRTDVARILIQLGRYDEAISATMQLPEGNDRDYLLALLHRAPDRQQDADAALERLSAGPRDVRNTIHLAEVYVDRGRRDEAFELLAARYREIDRDRAARPRARWYFQDELRLSPYLKALHGDPRWARLATIPD